MITVAEATVLQHVLDFQPIPVTDMKYIMNHISGEFGYYIQLTDEGFIITDTGRIALEEYEGAQVADAPDELAAARARIAELEALLSEAAGVLALIVDAACDWSVKTADGETLLMLRDDDGDLVSIPGASFNGFQIKHLRAIADFAARLKAAGVK